MSEMVPSGVRLGIVRGISYGLFGKPDEFVPELRELGATLIRVYFYWSQIEPEPGDYTFEVVDAFLDQLNGSEEVWVTVCSSSRWATEQATDFLPPSPAKDIAAYDRFVQQLVQHCAGRVHYWQCDNEPSNVGLTWAGTADSYLAQLRAMHRAVKETDPNAAVVLGGAPYALPSSAPDSPERQFFDVLLREGRDFFDLFDLHLYGQADLILSDIETARGMMRAFGYEKPLVVGEYNAPWPNLYPEATAAMEQTMAAAFAAGQTVGGGPNGHNADGAAVAPQRSPEEIAMESLYEQMASLPLQLQMFMRGCPPELEEKRHRINCRELVMRNLLALSAGVRRTACWNLAPEIPGYQNPLSIMDLLFGKLALLDFEGTELRRRYPSAKTFARLAGQLADVESVNRVKVPAQPELFLFEVDRAGREPMFVVWAQRDSFTGEDELTVTFDWIWPAAQASAVDALGQAQSVELHEGRLTAQVSLTPLFITAN
jgi:Beta-galactosidase